jgi:purine nucleosidase/pyrimidine-specific ribonucleoside hydrolase
MSEGYNMNKVSFFKFLPILLVMLAACQGQPKPNEMPVPTSEAATTGLPKILRVLFDDDGSRDGTTALFFLLSDPEVSVDAITISYGEAHPGVYIQHIGRKLDEMQINTIPLGAGQDAPLAGSQAFPEWIRQDSNNFWGLPLPDPEKSYPVQDAATLMVTTINQSPQPVLIFVSGASTNLAQALQLDPGIRNNIEAVYMMGGAVYVSGNIQGLLPDSNNTVAEWNIYADPQAAKAVFESGLKIYLVPLDATNQVLVGKKDTGQWRAGGNTAQFATDIYDRIFNEWGTENAPIWDLMTAAIMTNPELCRFQALHLDVVTADGNTAGQTALSSDKGPNVNVCLEPDEALIKQTLVEVFSSSK